MAESASTYSRTETSPLTGPSSLGSAVDPQGLSTVPEVPSRGANYHGDGSLDKRLHSNTQPLGDSRDASLESSIGRSYEEKQSEPTAQHLRHRDPTTQTARRAWQRPEGPSSPQQNGHGNYRDMGPNRLSTKPTPPKKEKKGGLRNTLRRMFGRRSTRDRISVPNPPVYPRHVSLDQVLVIVREAVNTQQDPTEFITSATDIKVKRAASMPVPATLRSSGLSSHPPFQVAPSPPPTMKVPPPPAPERPPPERPERPRRASVPSLTFSKQEMEAVDAAMTGLGVQAAQEQQMPDAENIGFAVTNGSNPRRRSRSVGAYRDSDHRTSPIQWRRWRRRSDEIKYWRASSDLTSLGIKGLDSPVTAQKEDNDTVDEREAAHEEHNGNFNFGLHGDTLHNQERVGLEERIVTLEIKLMDFEYALSKMQAEASLPSRRHSQPIEALERQDSHDSNHSLQQSKAPLDPAQSTPQATPPIPSSQWVKDITPQPRPISVATTLKPGHAGQPGLPRNDSIDRSARSSLASLTIDHYTTLITLLRNEQSARRNLEQQVSILQGRLDALSPPHSSHSQDYSISQQSHSHSRSLSSSQRRQGFVDLRGGKREQIRPLRPRSSSYSTNETDTDDDAFHDVYATPNITPSERGEYERGAFDRVAGVEEGMAF